MHSSSNIENVVHLIYCIYQAVVQNKITIVLLCVYTVYDIAYSMQYRDAVLYCRSCKHTYCIELLYISTGILYYSLCVHVSISLNTRVQYTSTAVRPLQGT